MNQNLKIVGILALLCGVVFALTMISSIIPNPPADPNKQKIQGGDTGQVGTTEHLLFATKVMRFDPNTGNVGHKYFQMFYEVSETHNTASFWFVNPNPYEVQVGATARSCSVCTKARVGVVNPQARKEMLQDLAAGSLLRPGAFGFDVMTMIAAAKLERSLNAAWVDLEFPMPPQTEPPMWAPVPPAQPDGIPTLGILQVMFQTKGVFPKPIAAKVSVKAKGFPPTIVEFNLSTIGVEAFEVTPPTVDFGEIGAGSSPKKHTVYCVSYTRGFQETVDSPPLGMPEVKLDVVDPFLTVSEPVRLTDSEIDIISRSFSAKSESGPHRIKSGYKAIVTLNRQIEGKSPSDQTEPDIGPLQRTLTFSIKGEPKSHSAAITANIVGLVNLIDGGGIELGRFNGVVGTAKEVTLWSEQKNLELEVVNGEHSQKYFHATIATEQREDQKRKYWKLRVTVDPKQCLKPIPSNSFIMLRGKIDGKERKVRLVVSGQGTSS